MLVIDNSVFASALFADEQQSFAVALFDNVTKREEKVRVPHIFLYEAYNVVLNALKRKRINNKVSNEYFQIIAEFPVQIDSEQQMQDVAVIAVRNNLSIYDAAYLELAKRTKLPLATFDTALITAAKNEKVQMLF